MFCKHVPSSKLVLSLTLLTYHSQKRLSPPACFETATIGPVPKESAVCSFSDFCHVALNPILIKCSDKLVLQHVKDNVPASLHPQQYAFRTNRAT